MAFTIEVKRIGRNADFLFEDFFEDLEIFHQGCGAGEIQQSKAASGAYWTLTCLRCGERITVPIERTETEKKIDREGGVLDIIRTALDGQTREMSSWSYWGEQKITILEPREAPR